MKSFECLLFQHTTKCITTAQTRALTVSNTNFMGQSLLEQLLIRQMTANSYDTVLHRDDASHPLTAQGLASSEHSMDSGHYFARKGSPSQPLALHVHLQQASNITVAKSYKQEITSASKVYLQSYLNEADVIQVLAKARFCITNHFLTLVKVHFY